MATTEDDVFFYAVLKHCKIIESALLSKCNINHQVREEARQALEAFACGGVVTLLTPARDRCSLEKTPPCLEARKKKATEGTQSCISDKMSPWYEDPPMTGEQQVVYGLAPPSRKLDLVFSEGGGTGGN
ncbi:hypothetical protein TNIN_463511 [Trichonephila inaurata madagascariensis]|uniref:Uncharacterized protein n=1 Tax=Trichonephila inaurata madagascariensis TaxID=2747483 RepID=A0A8X6X8X8_9ARAC|nr:hypothetical protein TNIN_463511 [Trichonephila inaurata madagascariensis]